MIEKQRIGYYEIGAMGVILQRGFVVGLYPAGLARLLWMLAAFAGGRIASAVLAQAMNTAFKKLR